MGDSLREIESALRALGHLSDRVTREVQEQTGTKIDKSTLYLLVRLSECGQVRLTRVAEVVGLDLSTISRKVEKLEERGLVLSERDPKDARAHVVCLSDEGEQLLKTVNNARRKVLSKALADWPRERRELLAELLGDLAIELSTLGD